ncbi:MAG: hypothetical protein Kow0096_12490 [Thiohalomonadaceae bacterium]
MIELSPSRSANILAVAAILGILGTFALVWQAGEGVGATAGPNVLATAEDAVYFIAGGTLYHADGNGALQDAATLASLGLPAAVSHLAVMPDALLVAEGRRGTVQRCDLPRRTCVELARIPLPPKGATLALAHAPQETRFYVADSARHELHAWGLDGKHQYRLTIAGGLKYPNDLAWLGAGQLLVTDTNHHRVLVIEDQGRGRSRVVQQVEAANPLGSFGNTWPTAAARDGAGRVWAVNSNGLLQNGEIIVFDAAGTARQRIALAGAADPIALAPLPQAMLVLDHDHYRLQAVSLEDFSVRDFGDDAVQGALRALQARRGHWQQIRYFSLGMMVLFGLLGALAGYLDWQARRRLVPGERRPGVVQHPADVARQVQTAAASLRLRSDAQGVTWLAVNPKFLRLMRLLLLAIGVLFGLIVMLFYSTCNTLSWDLISLLGAVSAAVMAAAFWAQYRMQRMRIGTDGTLIHVVDILGRQGQGTPEEFVQTGRRLLLGRVAVPLPNPAAAVFDKDAFAALFGPLLERVPRSNEFAILWRDLRRGDPLTWGSLVAVIVFIALRVWFEF